MSVDLPEPDTPVTTVITPSGIFTLTFLRLFSRAPVSSKALRQGRRTLGTATSILPLRYWPV